MALRWGSWALHEELKDTESQKSISWDQHISSHASLFYPHGQAIERKWCIWTLDPNCSYQNPQDRSGSPKVTIVPEGMRIFFFTDFSRLLQWGHTLQLTLLPSSFSLLLGPVPGPSSVLVSFTFVLWCLCRLTLFFDKSHTYFKLIVALILKASVPFKWALA